MTDEQILRKMRGRDPAGLEMLMARYIPYVSTVVWNILRGTMTVEDAEEVALDVFLTAWERAADIQPLYTKAWLGAVARNKAKTRLRKAGRELPLEEDLLELPDESDPAEDAQRAEEQRLVRQAVEGLGEPDREIFLRHYYYAQTVTEIAGEMHLNESSIKTKLRRGRMRLKTLLLRWGAV